MLAWIKSIYSWNSVQQDSVPQQDSVQEDSVQQDSVQQDSGHRDSNVPGQKPKLSLILNGRNYLIQPGHINISLDLSIKVPSSSKSGYIASICGPFPNCGTLTINYTMNDQSIYIGGNKIRTVVMNCTFQDVNGIMTYHNVLNCELSSIQGCHIIFYAGNKEKIVILNLNADPLHSVSLGL